MTLAEQVQATAETYIRTQASSAIPSYVDEGDNLEKIETTFGEIGVDRAKKITFKNGIPGLAKSNEFALAFMPRDTAGSYLILQSLEDSRLSLITIPMDPKLNLIKVSDMKAVAKSVGGDIDDCLFLLLVSIRMIEDQEPLVTVNLRAPIVININTKTAEQHILNNASYDLRYPINKSE